MKKTAIIQAEKIAETLKNEAQSLGLPISDSTDLYKLAIGAIRKKFDLSNLKGGMTIDDLVLGVIQQLIVKSPGKPLENYHRKYLAETLIPNIVLQMKSKGFSLDKIQQDKNILKILDHFDFDSKFIEMCFTGEKKPFKTMKKDIDLDKMLSDKPRPNIFNKFKGKDEPEFISFWTTSVVNKAKNFIKENKDKFIDHAKSFGNFDKGDEQSSTVSDSHHIQDVVDDVTVDDKFLKNQILEKLENEDPRYVKVFDIIKESDSSSEIMENLKTNLKLESYAAKKFLEKYTAELRRIVLNLELDSDDLRRVFRAKIARSIVRRIMNVSLL